MSEQKMNKTNKTNNKNKKEELSPLYKKLSLGPEIRSEEPKGVYPKGRVKQVFAVMSGEMNSLMRVNAWFLLFAIPLFFVLYWCSNYFTSLATSKFDFMGNVGMAFPGGADTLRSIFKNKGAWMLTSKHLDGEIVRMFL